MPPNFKIDESIYKDVEEETLNDVARTIEMVLAIIENALGDTEGFQKLLEDAKKPLFKRCTKFTKLSAIVKLFNIKARSGRSDKSFSDVWRCSLTCSRKIMCCPCLRLRLSVFCRHLEWNIRKYMHAPMIAYSIEMSMKMQLHILCMECRGIR